MNVKLLLSFWEVIQLMLRSCSTKEGTVVDAVQYNRGWLATSAATFVLFNQRTKVMDNIYLCSWAHSQSYY